MVTKFKCQTVKLKIKAFNYKINKTILKTACHAILLAYLFAPSTKQLSSGLGHINMQKYEKLNSK